MRATEPTCSTTLVRARAQTVAAFCVFAENAFKFNACIYDTAVGACLTKGRIGARLNRICSSTVICVSSFVLKGVAVLGDALFVCVFRKCGLVFVEQIGHCTLPCLLAYCTTPVYIQVTLMGSAEVLAAPTEKVQFMEDMKTEVRKPVVVMHKP